MAEQPKYIDDECLAIMAEAISQMIEIVIRPLYAENIAAKSTLLAWKKTHPGDAKIIDEALEMALHSEHTKKTVDAKIESILPVLRAMGGPNPDHVLQGIFRLFEQSKIVN